MRTLATLLFLALASPAFAQVTPATITSPVANSRLPGPSVVFSWTAGVGVTNYWLELGTVPGGNDIFSHPSQTPVRTQTVTGIPTDGRPIYARLYSITNMNQWYMVDTTYTAAGTVPDPIPITGLSKIGWTQPGQTPAQATAGVTTLYIDSTAGVTVKGVACTTTSGLTTCTAPLPALTPGVHIMSITYRTSMSTPESPKSNEISVTTATVLTPASFGLRP